ncbi:MAG: MBL fold metallo-hydrolase [Bacteroidota bacterium]
MALYTASLNSGSNGNCYYIGNAEDAVLIDAGISCRETERRMERLGLDVRTVRAIFISHEHSDHIRGVEVLSRKYRIPVYITAPTLMAGSLAIDPALIRSFRPHETICIGELSVIPFPKSHDAAEPFSYVVKNREVCIGVMTDIGSVCDNVIRYFKQCHAVFLEANYDVTMLETGHYPAHLKRRISSHKGHLSNEQALELFTSHRSSFLSHVFLSHLSKENNDPQTASTVFQEHCGHTQIIVASRYGETPLFCITERIAAKPVNVVEHVIVKQVRERMVQMALFD